MQQEADVIQDLDGNAVSGAAVTVIDKATGELAALFADNETTSISNPVYTDANGRYAYKAKNGKYRTSVSIGGRVFPGKADITLFDPVDSGFPTGPDQRYSYRKAVVGRFPRTLPDAAAVIAAYGEHQSYQAATIDPVTRELFLASASKQIISVYDWDSRAYKRSFSLAQATVVTENLVIEYAAGKRFLCARSSNDSLHKYDITVLPPALSTLTAFSVHDIGVDRSFSHKPNQWTVEDRALPLSGKRRRHRYIKYDDNFTRTGDVDFGLMNSGAGEDSLYAATGIPKHQGFCDYESGYMMAFGGSWAAGQNVDPYAYQGVKFFNGSGGLAMDSLLRPDLMRDVLLSKGIPCSKVENEGVLIGPDGQLLTMYITLTSADPEANADGVLFLEEFSAAGDAIDFSSCAVSFSGTDVRLLQSGFHPRSYPGNKLPNTVTGGFMETWDAIMDYMAAVDQNTFKYYSSSVAVNDINGVPVANGMVVEITNSNNSTFWVEATGFNLKRYWRVSGASGSRTQSEHFPLPFAKQTVTGSRSGNAALADLLSKLAALNIITDNTTA